MSSSGRKRRKPERMQHEKEPGIKTCFRIGQTEPHVSAAALTALCPHFVPRDREERLAALSAAQQEAMEELQKKIQMKVWLHPRAAREPERHRAPVSSWFSGSPPAPPPLQHDESSRRHMEQIEQRKEKAAELSSGRHANTDYAPKLTPYERKKQCSLCCVEVCRI